jgi:glycosyltransferase involved in cell wall biosynthesis
VAPLVSVIIPSYNYARFMAECVASVVDQSYRNIELVIVDDRSTDGSESVVHELFASTSLVDRFQGRLVFETNSRNIGAHATINRGIQLSSGDYVAILNADDAFVPDRISVMQTELQRTDRSFGFSAVEFIDEVGHSFSTADPFARMLKGRQDAIDKFPTVGFACLASNVTISTGNFLFSRALFDQIGPFADLKYCHDWDFVLRALLVQEPAYIPGTTYKYRIHGSNSFKSLQSVAEAESSSVYRSFFAEISRSKYTNTLAPSPKSWPGVFELFMSAYGLWPYWKGELPDVSN